MAYDGKLMRQALARYGEDRQRREEEFRRRETELLRRVPRLDEIQRELRGTMAQIVTKALKSGADVERAMGEIRENNLALQRERAALLREKGFAPDALEYQPAC